MDLAESWEAKMASRENGMRVREGLESAEELCEASCLRKTYDEPSARNSSCRYARDETSWDSSAERVYMI